MRTSALLAKLVFTIVQGINGDREVTGGYTSDLLSDVIANCPAGAALITIQAHVNTIAVAQLADIPLIIICNNRNVPSDMLQSAIRENIALATTSGNQYCTSIRLHEALGS